jgi:hypothetical protein
MNQIKSGGDLAAFARRASEAYKAAFDLSREDGALRAFKYLLLRLTVGGLRMEEVDELRKVGKAVFAGSDPTSAANKVLKDTSSSPLAIAIASAALTEPPISRQRALLGSALGAHASLAMSGGTPDSGLVVYAAVIGSATAETTHVIHEFVGAEWKEFGSRD